MAKLIKVFEPSTQEISDFDLDGLEEFPAEARVTLDLGKTLEEEEEEEEFDPEALRAEVLAEAREEAARKVKEAYAEGLGRGEAEGRKAFDQSIARSAQALESAAAEMSEARQRFIDALEPQVAELSKLIALRVLAREVRCDPDLITATVRRALAALADRQQLLVRVNPADLDALREHEVKLLEEFTGIETLSVVPDEAIEAGGCIVVSETMQADARIENLLSSVLEALAG